MVNVSRFCILSFILLLPLTNCDGDSFDGGLQGIEIAPKVLTNVPYGNSRLPVWGYLNNPNLIDGKKKYFVMPVVMLLPKRAKCQSNFFTGQTTLEFKVLMWNENVATAVLIYLKEVTSNQQLRNVQITILPIEKLRLEWTNSAQKMSSFQLNTKWKSYANQEEIVRFELVVSSKEICDKALKHLQKRPESLGSLELQYVLHGSKGLRKQITVTGRHLVQSKMYAKMINKVDPKGNIYLNSEDLNKFTHEAVSTVVASSTTDSGYVDSGDSLSLSKLIYDSISSFKQTTTTMTPKMWQSTFWRDELTRPDKLTKYLNKVMTKDEGNTHTVHLNEKETKKEGSGKAEIGVVGLFTVGAGGDGKSNRKSHISDDKLKEWLKENKYQVEWTGEKFEVKPMELYRLNTQQLAQKQNIATTSVQVHHVEYNYNVKMSFPDDSWNIDRCKINQCTHGSCINIPGRYACQCSAGWKGEHCDQDINECTTIKPCVHGHCANPVGNYTCQCQAEWTGKNCDQDLDECKVKKPCNHGSCINTVGSFSCKCSAGWKGTICNEDINECVTSHPCIHGTCINKIGSYACACSAAWTGQNCDLDVNECKTQPCIEGSTCTNTHGGYKCSCSNCKSGSTLKWVLKAHTSANVEYADSDGTILLKLKGANGFSNKFKIGDHFEKGTIHIFTFSTTDVGTLDYITFEAGTSDGWHFDWVQLTLTNSNKIWTWEDQDGWVESDGIQRRSLYASHAE